MNVVVNQSILVTRAVEYIQEKISVASSGSLVVLIDEAAMRFNLSPAEVESLQRIFIEDQLSNK